MNMKRTPGAHEYEKHAASCAVRGDLPRTGAAAARTAQASTAVQRCCCWRGQGSGPVASASSFTASLAGRALCRSRLPVAGYVCGIRNRCGGSLPTRAGARALDVTTRCDNSNCLGSLTRRQVGLLAQARALQDLALELQRLGREFLFGIQVGMQRAMHRRQSARLTSVTAGD
jgi:hypothetical protein